MGEIHAADTMQSLRRRFPSLPTRLRRSPSAPAWSDGMVPVSPGPGTDISQFNAIRRRIFAIAPIIYGTAPKILNNGYSVKTTREAGMINGYEAILTQKGHGRDGETEPIVLMRGEPMESMIDAMKSLLSKLEQEAGPSECLRMADLSPGKQGSENCVTTHSPLQSCQPCEETPSLHAPRALPALPSEKSTDVYVSSTGSPSRRDTKFLKYAPPPLTPKKKCPTSSPSEPTAADPFSGADYPQSSPPLSYEAAFHSGELPNGPFPVPPSNRWFNAQGLKRGGVRANPFPTQDLSTRASNSGRVERVTSDQLFAELLDDKFWESLSPGCK